MYRAPLRELRFVLHELVGDQVLTDLPHFADYSVELADSVLEQAAKFAEEILAPINRAGDLKGAQWTAEGVKMPAEFKSAYAQFTADGWTQLRAANEYGGQGAPTILGTAVEELWASSNLSFKLCPMLTQGAIEAIERCGTPEQKRTYLSKLVSGEWTGTMNLTESQAGSDLGAIRTRAARDENRFRLYGQKIFITYGDHDYTDNTIHLVLARIDGSPPGTKGISMFIVPKVLVNADGSLGERNDVRCVSIEHKLGIHASPTCVLAYGDRDGAIGYLVGEENRGLEYMFIMMNAARLSVGLEGYALAERAYQQALNWARERVQGRPSGKARPADGKPLPIAYHPDVKRMLLTMKAYTDAARAIALYASLQLDIAKHHPEAQLRAIALARGELLIPIVKGWSTEIGVSMTSLGIQVHGGMGYIEETGAAQFLRDARIATIYEGTTGIQANDLLGRKIARDSGAAMTALINDMRTVLETIATNDADVARARTEALAAIGVLSEATVSVLRQYGQAPEAALSVAVPYLTLCGVVIGGWLMAKSQAIASNNAQQEPEFYRTKQQIARCYFGQVLPESRALAQIVTDGGACIADADAALL
jgi:alkylation response protein AidB-like acyl-CoA dehydrogenase